MHLIELIAKIVRVDFIINNNFFQEPVQNCQFIKLDCSEKSVIVSASEPHFPQSRSSFHLRVTCFVDRCTENDH